MTSFSCSMFEKDVTSELTLEVSGKTLLLKNNSSFSVAYFIGDEDFLALVDFSLEWNRAPKIEPNSTITITREDISGGNSETTRLYLLSRPEMDATPFRLVLDEGFFQD